MILGHSLNDVFKAVSDAAHDGGTHAAGDLGKAFGDVGKLVTDLEHGGHRP